MSYIRLEVFCLESAPRVITRAEPLRIRVDFVALKGLPGATENETT
jgi:hypothetical protein